MELPFFGKTYREHYTPSTLQEYSLLLSIWIFIFNIFIVPLLVIILLLMFAVGAARLANQRSNNFLLAGIAFVLSPFYYIYHAFTE